MPARLTVVGTGIQSGRDLSRVAIDSIQTAGKVFVAVTDPVTERWVQELNDDVESLAKFYSPRKRRVQAYDEMTDRIMSFVERGVDVCVVCYGHPGVCVYPTRKAIQRARALGVRTTMLPAVSFIDCLIADLDVDPAIDGLALYDATSFLMEKRSVDACSGLVLMQIAVTAEAGYPDNGAHGGRGLRALIAKLARTYGKRHEVVIYEASVHPLTRAVIRRLALEDVASARLPLAATLYVPPRGKPKADKEMLRRFPVE